MVRNRVRTDGISATVNFSGCTRVRRLKQHSGFRGSNPVFALPNLGTSPRGEQSVVVVDIDEVEKIRQSLQEDVIHTYQPSESSTGKTPVPGIPLVTRETP